jgi:hypothetical protein
MKGGAVKATQKAKVVEKGAELENVRIKKMTGGTVDAKSQADVVKGKMIGVSMDKLE